MLAGDEPAKVLEENMGFVHRLALHRLGHERPGGRGDRAPRARAADVVDDLSRQAELDADYQEKKAHLAALEKELQRLKGEMGLVKDGSTEHRNLQTQLLHGTADLQFEAEQSEKDFIRKRATKFKIVLDLIHKKTVEYCKSRNIDMVLQKKLTLEENMPSWESVFYHRPEFEITDDVIRLINGT